MIEGLRSQYPHIESQLFVGMYKYRKIDIMIIILIKSYRISISRGKTGR
jgi:hypothetical protein